MGELAGLPEEGTPAWAESLSWLFWLSGALRPTLLELAHYHGAAGTNEKNTKATRIGLLHNMMVAHGREAPTVLPQEALQFGVRRHGLEARRLLSVLEVHLSDGRAYIVGGAEGSAFGVADMALVPWVSDCLNRTQLVQQLGIDARLPPLPRCAHGCCGI